MIYFKEVGPRLKESGVKTLRRFLCTRSTAIALTMMMTVCVLAPRSAIAAAAVCRH